MDAADPVRADVSPPEPEGRGPAPASEPGGRRRAELLVFLLCWLPHAWLVRCFWYLTDDAFITFRYAKNLAAGHGPRFNLGDGPPVEGYSNFLWMVVCAGFELLGLDIELWPALLSAACATVFLWLAYRLFLDRLGLSLPLAAIATLLVGVHPPFTVYATSGLAMMPYALALFVGFERLVLRRGAPHGLAGGLALLAAALLRVEGVWWALVILLLAAGSRLLARERFAAALAKAAGVLAVGYGAYWAWRYSYYGHPFPNTVYAKSGIRDASPALWLERGFQYVMVQWLTHLVPFVTLVAAPLVLRRGRRAIGLPVAAMAFAFPVYSILTSGDFMAMSRFLLPGWIFSVILIAWLLADLAGDGRAPARRLASGFAGAGLVVVGSLSAFDVHLVPQPVRERFHFRWKSAVFRSEYEQWEIMAWNAKRWAVIGRALKKWLPEGGSAAWGSIGAVGYYSDLFIYDTNGLVTKEVAMGNHMEIELTSPGHDRRVNPGYFLSRRPTLLRAEILDGQPGVEDGRDRIDARSRFLQLMQEKLVEPLKSDDVYKNLYVTDFRPLPGWEDDACRPFGRSPRSPFAPAHSPHPGQYLVFWRLQEEGTTMGEAWQNLHLRMLQYQERGVDRYRRELRTGWPRPGWAGGGDQDADEDGGA